HDDLVAGVELAVVGAEPDLHRLLGLVLDSEIVDARHRLGDDLVGLLAPHVVAVLRKIQSLELELVELAVDLLALIPNRDELHRDIHARHQDQEKKDADEVQSPRVLVASVVVGVHRLRGSCPTVTALVTRRKKARPMPAWRRSAPNWSASA